MGQGEGPELLDPSPTMSVLAVLGDTPQASFGQFFWALGGIALLPVCPSLLDGIMVGVDR